MDWKVLTATFGLLLLAELGDKTQLAVISMTCKTGKPWMVFLGAALALVAVTLIGAFAGQVISQVVPAQVLNKVAAALFVVMGVAMWFGVF
ncbi:MAG: TMEM165/GDT1 family protein [Chloroflexi bacterium]|nr:TMEM165/GDT1 family protein [Chloroflexota bacterium]